MFILRPRYASLAYIASSGTSKKAYLVAIFRPWYALLAIYQVEKPKKGHTR